MDTSGYTNQDDAGWASSVKDTAPAEVIKTTGERVRKTVLAILDQLNTHQAGSGTPPGLERDTPTARKDAPDGGMSRPSSAEPEHTELPVRVPVLVGRGL